MSHGVKQTLFQGYEHFVKKNEDGCWGWTGCISAGYGQFRSGMKQERAHRASWILNHGPIPVDKQVLHTCNNRICSNPKHLYLGTSLDNNRDILASGIVFRDQYGRFQTARSTI